MQHNQKKSDGLAALLAKGLISYSEDNTAKQLGDRTQYVGMSDIGKGMECIRSAVAGKAGMLPKPDTNDLLVMSSTEIYQTLGRQIVLQRGHWLEAGLEKALSATGVNLVPQLEISVTWNHIPIKAHLDFTMVWAGKKPAVRILELKNNQQIPDFLYASYEAQLYGQTGLLKSCWSQPCFSVEQTNGLQIHGATFPEIMQQLFGITLPLSPDGVDIESWVLSISMSRVKPFGPYLPDNSSLNTCLAVAKKIWTAKEKIQSGLISINDLEYCRGFHPLCDWCDVNEDCPKFMGKDITNLDTGCDRDLKELARLKDNLKDLDESIKIIENRIKKTYFLANKAGDNTWLTTDGFRFKVSTVAGRKTLDQDFLVKELAANLDETAVRSIIKQSENTGKAFERLYVSKINKISNAAA
ncbi:MAG: hypothetical protein A2464_07405 [Deltaproteobacteria bacterium RIFOXYC2_FULL_48_10]|nr:MAG: hypothetical protein A2464_07405 [Deltaproteobacteria bacterium RIFOXYC2_FULL_48_10]